ncbi:hypothetical protein CHARACLAT_003601 [Characodon lateralis]|uniref:Uncharacterized protein n=1 Tax=Characodon lateralis TaxID=208331 RepID=A0ABU7EG36_9TELE|nr:hypothetical protein [Characodon lateralis]
MNHEGHILVSFSSGFNAPIRLCCSYQPVVLKQRAAQAVLPPISNRTLQHPSFLPLYMPTRFDHHFHGDGHPSYPMTPAELFYTDPALPCGRRIYSSLSGKMVFDVSQLNAPPPIMSACVATPNRPDPFRAGPYPINNQGSPSWKIQSIPPQEQLNVVIQLTQQEDQAITNLLKLHHQEALQSKESIIPGHTDFPGAVMSNPRHFNTASLDGATKVICNDALEEGGKWSEAEYDAANTLLSSFNQMDDYLIGETATLPDQLLSQNSETELERQSFSPLVTCYCSQNGSCIQENGEIRSEEDMVTCAPVFKSKQEPGNLQLKLESGSEERTLTDMEGDAVQVLLGLGEVITFNVMQ